MDDSRQQRDELARQCNAAFKDRVSSKDLWHLIVEHPWYRTMAGTYAFYAVLRSRLPLDWQEDIASDAQEPLAKRLALDRYLGADPDLVEEQFIPQLRRATRNDCRQAARIAERAYRRRDSNVDPDDLPADEQLPDVRMDFESLLPRLSDRQRMAVVLYDEGISIPEIARTMRLKYRGAYNDLKKALKRLGRWM